MLKEQDEHADYRHYERRRAGEHLSAAQPAIRLESYRD
jgi:hypothetical protein